MKHSYVKKILILSSLFIFITTSKLHAANFMIANGDVIALANAITISNTNSQPDTINLAAFGTYTLTTEAYTGVFGSSGLPIIWEDGTPLNELHIFGNGATITRDITAPKFRLMNCIQGTVYINDVIFSNGYIQSSSDSGGGLIVNGGTYYISNCTFLNNKSGFQGGALFVWTSSTATVSNCTFTGNTAPMCSAICNWDATAVYVYNSTIVGNFTTGATGFGTVDNVGNNYTYIRNSIIANNSITSGSAEVNGTTISQGGNIIGSENSTLLSSGNPSPSGDNIGTTASPADAKVNAIADNGGFTPTMSLQSNSPAINKGNVVYNVAQDQRTYTRQGVMDIGAFEYGGTKSAPAIATSGLSVTVGPAGTLLTLSGINMTSITEIKFQGAAAVTTGFTNNTDHSVTVAVPAGATSGKITVTTALGTSALSAQAFTVGSATPAIATTGLSATSGPVGSLLTITGTNLAGITEIKFQGAAAVTTGFINNSATSVTVTVPIGATTGTISVTTAAGGLSAQSTQTFTITNPLPAIASTGLSVTSGPIGTLLTITGTNLSGITQIKFQTAAAVTTGFTNNTATSVTVEVPAGATSGKITVTNAGGTSALSTQTFTVIIPVPTIESLTPTSGSVGSSLTILGTSMSGITKIKFQGAAAVTTGFTNNTESSVTVTVPVGATTGKITVTTAGGTSELSTQTFTITTTTATINATLKNVELYPNPFEETFTIDLNGAASTTDVRILSLTGEVVKQVQLNNYSTLIDTQSLDAGIYIVHVFNDAGEQMTYRMVKK
ncbi:choice-of-anchor Q domain-containing protein [Cytophaga aurantiaca]|uniref:choice-of-anchor Q domain-containing protein n=1 Tax=Cytophaga aurantiaca TaxID=29530 RepID=UPI00039DDAC5|nr:choice-of-anchor Q domain-containing protein [Cytophaga aurantiaca]